MMKPYEFIVYYADCTGSAILVQPTVVLAKCEDHVRTLAARAIPAEHADKLDKVTITVRPF